MVSCDRVTWYTRVTVAVRDLAVSPTNPDTLLATTEARRRALNRQWA
jgi:hypothetical protein